MARGTIEREHIVWCGRCGHWQRYCLPTKAATARSARLGGWKQIESVGWMCQICQTTVYGEEE